jgi:putative ABC transport system ATP-binding protein
MLIAIKDLWKTYPMGKVVVNALKGIDLEIAPGGFIAVAGASGSGKTTLMNIIGLIDRPTKGSVFIKGRETGSLGKRDLIKMRQELIGFIFQSFNLFPVLNVFENVELPLVITKKGGTKAQRAEKVFSLLEAVGLENRIHHKPAELSGGEQQRVAVARALVNHPGIIIADEPTANLDSANGDRIVELLKKISREEDTTVIFSTHDPVIREMADHIIVLRDGMVESEEQR